ncbi:site-specific integrase [Desulfogranum marinum]|uniref:tyrosine-type recombinase/integrase n=1 Tax=Desulfogranum marinum TaxID=453220 RepID=UPI0029C80C00|nr:site-specific integrase [Desulfogranum marinum]
MKGGIYTDQKCSVCGHNLKDDGKKAVRCPLHPQQVATSFRVHFDRVKRRFKSYPEAQRFLTGLRYKTDEDTFDAREYSSKKPLSFANLASSWLTVKEDTVKKSSYNNLHNYMMKAIDAWGHRNIKEIGFADIEDFFILHRKKLSSKTLSNMRSALHDFFNWLVKREVISKIPNFPVIKVQLAYRQIIGKETQQAILEEIYRIAPFKVWLGIKWLCTYIAIRPGELVQIREQDIDTENRYIYIHHSKTGETKPVPILDEDIELYKQTGPSFPRSYFFRHDTGKGGISQGQEYGDKYFYKWWKKACKNIEIEGVDLYGGTRHSSAVALRKHFSPEQIKQGTMHQTNKAFERYFRIGSDDIRSIYQQASDSAKTVTHIQKTKI